MRRAMGKTTRKLTPLGDVLAGVLKDRGLAGGLDTAKLDKFWEKAAGGGIAAHARPEMLSSGRLKVVVDSSAWMNQLSILAPEIIRKLNAVLGREEITELRFRLGRPGAGRPGAGKKPAAVENTPVFKKLSDSEREEISRALADVRDEGLKKSIGRVLEASCRRKKGPGGSGPGENSR